MIKTQWLCTIFLNIVKSVLVKVITSTLVRNINIKVYSSKNRRRLGVPFIRFFVYSCRSYGIVALMLCCNSIAPSSCKDDVSASAICHL